MSDIVERITSWADATPDAVTSRLLREAATEINVQRACTSAGRDEIAHLRSRPCPYVTGTVTKHCTLNTSEKPNSSTLTDAERLSIQWVIGDALSVDGISIQDTLRGLLERMQ